MGEGHSGFGDDNFFFNIGDGQDVITDSGFHSTDHLFFEHVTTDATFSCGLTNDNTLIISSANGDSVTFTSSLAQFNSFEIEELIFNCDATPVTLAMADIRDMLRSAFQTIGDDVVFGFDVDVLEIFEAGTGNDFISGGDGDDLHIYNVGDGFNVDDGADIIREGGQPDDDVTEIRGYDQPQAQFFSRVGNSNDELIDFGKGDEIIVVNGLGSSFNDSIESFIFFRVGTPSTIPDIVGIQQIRDIILAQDSDNTDNFVFGFETADIITAGAGDDINGRSGADNITGGSSNDMIIGGDGSDKFIFNLGDGLDTLEDNCGSDMDIVQFTGNNAADAFSEKPISTDYILISFIDSTDTVLIVNGVLGNFRDGIEMFELANDELTFDEVIMALGGLGVKIKSKSSHTV